MPTMRRSKPRALPSSPAWLPRPRAPTRSSTEAIVPDRLPMTLRLYRGLTSAATPLAPYLLSHRLKRGKEHPRRLLERQGESTIGRPPGPLVWIHGASVGEMLAVIPLIERIRTQN